jgi:hypothetical protein
MVVGDGVFVGRKVGKRVVMDGKIRINRDASKDFLEDEGLGVGDANGMAFADDLEGKVKSGVVQGGLVENGERESGIRAEDGEYKVGRVLVGD